MHVWEVSSTTISRIAYDDDADQLYVEFARSGKTYRFDGVTYSTVNSFAIAHSKGAFFNANIRNKFPETQCAAFPCAASQRPTISKFDWSRCGPKLVFASAGH